MVNDYQIISEKAGMRRFRRIVPSFNPNAVDGDNDGFVNDGTPAQRPATPSERINIKPTRTLSSGGFWDYRKPRQLDPLPELDDQIDKPDHTPWREIPLRPRGGEIRQDTVIHEIRSSKVTHEKWNDFQDAVLDRMMEIRDDTSIEKDERRGIMKLYSSIKGAKAKKNDDGSLSVSLTDTERARILKGIQSMKKKKYDIPNMDIISEMLEAVEKKTSFIFAGQDVSRPFSGVRYKSSSISRTYLSIYKNEDTDRNIRGRDAGLRIKGTFPERRIDVKALGTSISGRTRTTGRFISSTFDPNAVDADADGLVQDGTPFERPVAPKVPSIIGRQRPIRGGLPEGKPKPKRANSVMKAQADRKAMNFQIEKLRSTLRRVGDDYAPKWWNSKSDTEFSKAISSASPEELSEAFARIYVERRSLMESKVGKMPDGSIKVYADTPNDAAKAKNSLLKKRGEQVYREMIGRLLRDDMTPDERKKRGQQFNDWFLSAADNADWYFEQSFKITRRKSRKKLGINAPVNRRGTRWSEDPNFPQDSFERVVQSIETDLLRANPSMSRTSSRNRAEAIVREADKRISRTPNKTPRVGDGNRQIISGRDARNFARRITIRQPKTEDRSFYYDRLVKSSPNIKRVDYKPAMQNLEKTIAANQQRFGQMKTFDDYKKAFKSLSPDIRIDLFRSSYANRQPTDYEQALMHTYLDTLQRHPEILQFPVEIRKLSKNEVFSGTGGSHGLVSNLDDPAKPPFLHIFHYASEADQEAYYGDIASRFSNAVGMTQVSVTDGITNQVVQDYLRQSIYPNMPKTEYDDVISNAARLNVHVTSLHESGHGAHAAAQVIDRYGAGITSSTLKQQLDSLISGYSDSEFLKYSRGVIYDDIKHQTDGIFGALAGFSETHSSSVPFGVDWFKYYEDVRAGRDPLSSLNPQQQIIAAHLNSLYGNGAQSALAAWYHIQKWQGNRKSRYDMSEIEKFVSGWQSDNNLKNILTLVDKFPIDSQGKFDIAKMRDPKNVFGPMDDGNGNTIPYTIINRMTQTAAVRLTTKFQYDSLSKADEAIATDALEKLSDYARRTSRYGASFGRDSNVEGIAELNAANISGVLASKPFSAEEKRVLKLLIDWLERPKST